MIRIEHAYDTMSAAEGNRFPVDRRWPSGVGVFSLRREEVEI
jgi:uncharacterized protein YeaO (DUF488 family)